jgi:predicted RNase H-like HicB family nuclease
MGMERNYHLKIWKDEGDYYGVQCLEIPQAISQGKTIDECIKNAKEAIELALEYSGAKEETPTYVVDISVRVPTAVVQ